MTAEDPFQRQPSATAHELCQRAGRAARQQFVAHNHALQVAVPAERGEKAAAHRGQVVLGVRPEDITVTPDGEIAGEVAIVEPLGRDDMLDVRVGDHSLLVLADPAQKIKTGDSVRLRLDTDRSPVLRSPDRALAAVERKQLTNDLAFVNPIRPQILYTICMLTHLFTHPSYPLYSEYCSSTLLRHCCKKLSPQPCLSAHTSHLFLHSAIAVTTTRKAHLDPRHPL
jgi:hypothetical protein